MKNATLSSTEKTDLKEPVKQPADFSQIAKHNLCHEERETFATKEADVFLKFAKKGGRFP